MQQDRIRFHKLLELRLEDVIKKNFASRDITTDLLREIREKIKEEITTVFSRSKHKLTNESIVWLTDQFFKSIQIADGQLVADVVVIHEYSLSQLPLENITLLRDLFTGTRLFAALNEEHTKRVQS